MTSPTSIVSKQIQQISGSTFLTGMHLASDGVMSVLDEELLAAVDLLKQTEARALSTAASHTS